MRAELPHHKPSFRGGPCIPGALYAQGLWTLGSASSSPHASLSTAADCPRGSTESESDRQQSVLCQTEDKSSLESLLHLAMTWELASGFYTLKHPARAGSTADHVHLRFPEPRTVSCSINTGGGQGWCHTFIISAAGRLRREDHCQFKSQPGCHVRPCLNQSGHLGYVEMEGILIIRSVCH